MAVLESMADSNQNNPKKRKLSDNNGPDEDENKKKKVSDVDENETEVAEAKKITNFSVRDFRSALGTVEGLKSLRDFSNCAEWKTTENDVVLEYLQGGGDISEISSLLDVTAQGDLATALPVFRAIYFILIKIQSEAKEYQDGARKSIDNLISTYVPTFQAMINMNSSKHRKIVFKLMTAIVTFHSSYGRQILNWFTLTPQQLETLIEPGALRRSFVMFLVSFFVDGKVSVFRPLVEKKGYLSAIIPNLKFDDAKTVAVVLSVLKEKMLMNSGVTKTQKLNFFNTQIIQSLFQLFDWTGPKSAQKGWKKPKKLSPVDSESLEMVTGVLEEFLLVLCTCRKNGIAFHDKTLGSGPQMNHLILTALDVLPKPWKKPETSKLVIAILEHCPDLIKHCLNKWEASFEPRESPAWTTAIKFLIQVINPLQAELILKPALEVLSTQPMQNAIKAILVPPAVLKHLSSALETEKSLTTRCLGLELLTAILNKLNEFTVYSEQIRKNLKHIIRPVIPSAKWICDLWKNSENYKTISDFLLSLSKFESTFLDNSRRVCKALIQEIDQKEPEVQSAVLQTISLMDPTFLSPDAEQFEEALIILFHLAMKEKPLGGAVCALANMLLNTGLWDQSPEELDSWIGAWFAFPDESRTAEIKLFVKAVKKAALESKSLLSLISKEDEKMGGYLVDIEKKKVSKKATKLSKLEQELINFLTGNEKMRSLDELTVFACDRLVAVLMDRLPVWTDGSHEKELKKCQEMMETVFRIIPESCWVLGPALLSTDPTLRTLFNKCVSYLFSKPSMFKIYAENSFTTWLKDCVISVGLSNQLVNHVFLKGIKETLLEQIGQTIKDGIESITEDLEFWMMFISPTITELIPIFDQLCSQNHAAASAAIWLASLRSIKSRNIPKDLRTRVVDHLCRIVVLPESDGKYCQALLELVINQPLTVLEVPKDFVKSLLKLETVEDSLIKVGEYCVQSRGHRTSFLEAISLGSFNARTALVLLSHVFQYPGSTGALRKVVSQPTTKATKTVTTVAKAAKKVIKAFIRGEEDELLEAHLPTVLIAIQELGKKDKRAKSLISGLKGICPRTEVLTTMVLLANRVDPDVVLPWFKSFLIPSNESWEKQAEIFKSLAQDEGNLKAFVDLRQTRDWKDFVNSTLRNIAVNSEPHKMKILRTVTAITWSKGADNKELATIFHKCTSHSEFLSIMLSSAPIKGEILGLLLEIIRFWPDVMKIGHIPVYLAAYNASLSSCDQVLLKILRNYESHCGSLSKFDPLFWGQPAIAHYSLKGSFGLSLWKQVTMKSVLNLLDADKMKRSVSHFPINRKLQESATSPDTDVYDPAFLLPLFSNLFSPGAVSFCLSFISHGALSYTISALSSNDSEIRGAAAVVLSRFYSHLQLSQYAKQKPIWLHIIDCIRYGSENLATAPISGIVTLFLARAVYEISDPSSPLHVIHKFLLAKPSFNLGSLTEFSRLFFSDDHHYLSHRKWILEVIRDGVRQETDVQVIAKQQILRIILTAFAVVSNDHKILVLEAVEKIVKAGTSPKIINDELGLFSWIRNIFTFINGALVVPYVTLLRACVQYLLQMETQNGKITKQLCNVERLEIAIIQSCRKGENLEEIVRHCKVQVQDKS